MLKTHSRFLFVFRSTFSTEKLLEIHEFAKKTQFEYIQTFDAHFLMIYNQKGKSIDPT